MSFCQTIAELQTVAVTVHEMHELDLARFEPTVPRPVAVRNRFPTQASAFAGS